MSAEIANVVSAVSLTVAIIAVILLFLRQRASSTSLTPNLEQLRSLEANVALLREGRSEAERRLAAEERTASRVPDLEREVAQRLAQIDELKEAKGATERELATLREGLAQTKRSLEESGQRVLELGNEVKETEILLGTVRGEKSKAEESLAAKCAALGSLRTRSRI